MFWMHVALSLNMEAQPKHSVQPMKVLHIYRDFKYILVIK